MRRGDDGREKKRKSKKECKIERDEEQGIVLRRGFSLKSTSWKCVQKNIWIIFHLLQKFRLVNDLFIFTGCLDYLIV